MNRAGSFVKNLSGDAMYKSFKPVNLPPNPSINMDDNIIKKLMEAKNNLVELNTIATHIPDIDRFISMYIRKEALISSQIEGTQCTLDDVFDPNIENNVNLDVTDVINYVNAANYAIERLNKLPLCNRLLRETHEKLMEGVRGDDKNPGEFRRSQNWIGPANCSLKEARYIPPNVEDMESAMSELEKYINSEEDELDPLIKIALIHYQFETIHPFLDGNGRIGRLEILLYIMEQKILEKPVIYISYFLKKNQIEYYDRISEVRRTGNYEQWISFFLEVVSYAARDSIDTIEKIKALHEKNIDLLPKTNRKKDNLRMLFNYIEKNPIIDAINVSNNIGISYNTASNSIKKLVTIGILKEKTNKARNKVYAYEDYLEILRKDT